MQDPDDDDLIELVEEAGDVDPAPHHAWTVVIIDDDPAVHEGTRYALSDFVLNGSSLRLLSAYSAQEGRALLAREKNVAIVLLDVVMETDNAGLNLVSYIREELGDPCMRIILRTGQPGQAPERRVIVDYDINDYKAKTELTEDRLFTTVAAALRSYQQLVRLSQTRRGLEIILEAATRLYDLRSMQKLAEGVLTQLASLLDVPCAGILVIREQGGDDFRVLAGSGCYSDIEGELALELRTAIQNAFLRRCTEFVQSRSLLYLNSAGGSEVVVLLESTRPLSETDRVLVELFCSRLSVAFDNVMLYENLRQANEMLERRVQERTRELSSANFRLRAQWLQAKRRNAFQREMLGAVAHDIRNPLMVILSRAESMERTLLGDTPAPDRLKSQLSHIHQGATRLSDMVDRLLADALADVMDITLRREAIDFTALVRDVVEANLPLAERKQQVISVEDDGVLCVNADADRLREAVDNLISNAIKYSPLGGAVQVSMTAEAPHAVLRVRDSGCGLTEDDKTRMFGRFQRLSAQPTGSEPSTGLGLSIAKQIVDLHQGSIHAESEGSGRGSTFMVKLPLGAAS
jgi:signal transduction histidine kinase/DNA-binding NarL/FixJ family response regulator